MQGVGKRKALLIGNNTNASSGKWDPLKAAEGDTVRLGKVVQQFGKFEVITHCGQDYDTLMMAIQKNFLQGNSYDDILLFYFSGHGYRYNQELYFIVKDTTEENFRFKAIKIADVSTLIGESDSNRHIIILDCCNSGTANNVDLATLEGEKIAYDKFLLGQAKQQVIITASQDIQPALETVESGFFTSHLIKILESGEASGPNGELYPDSLFEVLDPRVRKTAEEASRRQIPTLSPRPAPRIPIAYRPDIIISELKQRLNAVWENYKNAKVDLPKRDEAEQLIRDALGNDIYSKKMNNTLEAVTANDEFALFALALDHQWICVENMKISGDLINYFGGEPGRKAVQTILQNDTLLLSVRREAARLLGQMKDNIALEYLTDTEALNAAIKAWQTKRESINEQNRVRLLTTYLDAAGGSLRALMKEKQANNSLPPSLSHKKARDAIYELRREEHQRYLRRLNRMACIAAALGSLVTGLIANFFIGILISPGGKIDPITGDRFLYVLMFTVVTAGLAYFWSSWLMAHYFVLPWPYRPRRTLLPLVVGMIVGGAMFLLVALDLVGGISGGIAVMVVVGVYQRTRHENNLSREITFGIGAALVICLTVWAALNLKAILMGNMAQESVQRNLFTIPAGMLTFAIVYILLGIVLNRLKPDKPVDITKISDTSK